MRNYRTGSTYRTHRENPSKYGFTLGYDETSMPSGSIPESHRGLHGPSGVTIGYFKRVSTIVPYTPCGALALIHTEIVNAVRLRASAGYAFKIVTNMDVVSRELFQPIYDDKDEYDPLDPTHDTQKIADRRRRIQEDYIRPSITEVLNKYYKTHPYAVFDLLTYLCNIFEIAAGHMPRHKAVGPAKNNLILGERYFKTYGSLGQPGLLHHDKNPLMDVMPSLEEVLLPWLHADSMKAPTTDQVFDVTEGGNNLMDVLGASLHMTVEMSPAEAEEAAARLAAAEQERATAAANLRHMLDLLDDLAVIPPK